MSYSYRLNERGDRLSLEELVKIIKARQEELGEQAICPRCKQRGFGVLQPNYCCLCAYVGGDPL
jgi:hypothetical protein